jgi:LruC domain-containing protein
MLQNIKYILFIFFIYTLSSCVPEVALENGLEESDEFSIDIPNTFDYSTHQQVEVEILDDNQKAKYDVFVYSETDNYIGNMSFEDESGNQTNENVYREDFVNKLVFSGVPKNGRITIFVTLPKYCSKVYVRRRENLKYSSKLVQINDQKVYYNHSIHGFRSSQKTSVEDVLYCVNGSGELFQVDPLNGNLTMVSEMPMGSYTAAIDQENKMLYSIGRSSPYPLMKYSIENDQWSTVANIGMGGPRLGFNTSDQLLYFSTRDKLYTIDPQTGQVLNDWTITGLHNISGGDLDFSEDGTLFLCTFSGLYRLEENANNEYASERISGDNLPFQPTSMTFDSNQELLLANNASSSDLIIMDTTTGGWQYNYGVNAGNNTNFNRTINDLTTFKIYSDIVDTTDSDGDGIIDAEDSYPDDAEKAFELFTPSKYGTGSIAFEDLWPTYGDYDFNDLAFTYRAIAVLNSNNLAVQLDFICRVKANGAGFNNGFGIEIEGLTPNQVESVSGTEYTYDYISFNSNGTEADQDNAVIIFTDNADNFLSERTVSIRFTEPISTDNLGVAPFNPFIIINQERDKEVHLPYRNRTNLGTNMSITDGINSDIDGNFISDNGMPWAISIIHDFKVPKENVSIYEAYNFFVAWASSGGLTHQDWYKDNPGFRNPDNLQD